MTGPHAIPCAGRAPAQLWKTARARAPGGQVAPTAGQAFRLTAGDPDRGCAARGGGRRDQAFLSYSYFFWCRTAAGPLIAGRTLADRPGHTRFGLNARIFAASQGRQASHDRTVTPMGKAEKVTSYAGR